MTKLSIDLSESDARKLRELAARENVTSEELAAKIIRAAIAQAEYFEQRAARGSRQKFLQALAKVPNVPPTPPDIPYDPKRSTPGKRAKRA